MPLIHLEEVSPQTFIGLWKIEESAEYLEKKLQLKAHELSVLRSLQGEKRNLHWLATRVLLRKMLSTEEYIDCQPDENGKPILLNLPHKISLSHSYDYAAVMISLEKEVGIDIEIIKEKIDRVKHKFLSDTELAFIEKKHNLEHLYACWCAKEALYKLNGKKETSFKDNIHLNPFIFQANGSIQASISKEGGNREFRVNYRKFGNYMLGYVKGD
ncbi:4'-phosphopantetheinyl transferase [Pseudopedobacter saltans DSM 12145]|uniref:4'-phosphopantetheinyl transferase n=1 Tax=Pseudopedobacter saltans (strain ATCC 51119 / DSM 12145 / JCM 21818 / CCUG 39354 / LMG 10337 / NBRC 100064 / NCIMB 13643) TaxID=762903 RepID=F0S4U0_PSESL|nr:4'-phosphopantetheinyl transferase family protein [Pseudopedobacter saltans]ADY54114.1 4'-phosphopantetheinyl transferase [Pseudopedobacter saltans DSM 12145]